MTAFVGSILLSVARLYGNISRNRNDILRRKMLSSIWPVAWCLNDFPRKGNGCLNLSYVTHEKGPQVLI